MKELKKRMNKKGQVESSKLTNWIIALLVLGAVAYGIFRFTGGVGEAAGNIPDSAELIIQACNGVATETFKSSYCSQVRKVDDDRYATCDYMNTFGIIIPKASDMKSICKNEESATAIRIRDECENLKENILVNGEACSQWKLNVPEQ